MRTAVHLFLAEHEMWAFAGRQLGSAPPIKPNCRPTGHQSIAHTTAAITAINSCNVSEPPPSAESSHDFCRQRFRYTTRSGTEPLIRVAAAEAGMNDPVGFLIEDGRAVHRPAGSVSFDEAVAWVRAAIAA